MIMVEVGILTGYQLLAKAVLYKAIQDSHNKDTQAEVKQFMRTGPCDTYCDMAGVVVERVKGKVLVLKTKPQPVDIYSKGVRIAQATSLNNAHKITGDNASVIAELVRNGRESVRGYKYRSKA
jgi:hypothetical protein